MSELINLELWPLVKLKVLFDQKMGAGKWLRFEPETILMELGAEATPLLMDKTCLLHIIEMTPSLPYVDPSLFLYAAEVINNTAADFEMVPHITMLEAAYAVHSLDKILLASNVTPEYPEALIKTCGYILRNDGCSEPIAPFTFVPKSELEKGQTESDTLDKKKAISMYIAHMDSL